MSPTGNINRRRLWNQDLAAELNFGDILLSLRETGARPERFLRHNEKLYEKRKGESGSSKKSKDIFRRS
jgi:hypothetical protein